MALPSDTECVILGRENKRKNLELLYIVKGENAIHRAWRLAHSIEKQEGRLGNKNYTALTAKSFEYFEQQKLEVLNPPRKFDFELPESDPDDASYVLLPDRPGVPEKQLEKLPPVEADVEVVGEVDVSDIASMFKDLGTDDSDNDEDLKPVTAEIVEDDEEEENEDDANTYDDNGGVSPDNSPDD